MKMSPEEVGLTIRNLNAGLLRAMGSTTANAIIRLNKGGSEMASAGAPLLFQIEDWVRNLEGAYGRNGIPAPPTAKAKTNIVIAQIALELQQLCDEIFTAE